ncbi:MAG TPA: LCP family protein [Chloroflexota bacterium]|nr:LCP family protein [Chloroflexota bacterium]
MRVLTVRARGRHGLGLTWLGAGLIAGCLVAVITIAAAGLTLSSAVMGAASASVLPAQSGALRWDGREPLTILLMGADSAHPDRAPDGSLIVASYRPRQHSLTFLAIPSNLWVTVPGYGQTTIGQAAVDGGPRLALTVAESATHVVIPWYAVVGTDTGRRLVDSLSPLRFGRTRLNGRDVLRYLDAPAVTTALRRERKVFSTYRQQELQPQRLFELPTVINALGAGLRTNLPYDQIMGVVRAVAALGPRQVHGALLDGPSGAVTEYRTAGQAVSMPAWNRIVPMTSSLFPRPRLSGRVSVLNASGLTGAAASLSAWLGAMGLPARGIGTARSTHPHTEVVINTAVSRHDRSLAAAVGALLQVPIVANRIPQRHEPVVVIIGQDYQYPGQ